ncbi:MAG: hypothetical protein D6788_06380, partial [Planctomycetota bacterium]
AYLFGNIAADIVFAKRLSRIKQCCHHWSTAFSLLQRAESDRDRAFAYGYLSHLAADTVAHGKYVPRQLVLTHMPVNVGHFFWELRADAMEPASRRRLLEHILEHGDETHHAQLARQLRGTLLPYDVNRALFHSVQSLTVRKTFTRGLGLWHECSRWYLSPELLAGYRSECLDRIASILRDGVKSPLMREDPNGTSALMQVAVHRREVRRLRRRGVPVHHRLRETSRGWAPDADRSLVN